MSDAPLGRFASSVVIDRRYEDQEHIDYIRLRAKHDLIMGTLDKLPEDQPFVFRYKTHVRKDSNHTVMNPLREAGDLHTFELEIEPVSMMRITMQEFKPANYQINRVAITNPASFWDKAKSWYEDAQKGVAYE